MKSSHKFLGETKKDAPVRGWQPQGLERKDLLVESSVQVAVEDASAVEVDVLVTEDVDVLSIDTQVKPEPITATPFTWKPEEIVIIPKPVAPPPPPPSPKAININPPTQPLKPEEPAEDVEETARKILDEAKAEAEERISQSHIDAEKVIEEARQQAAEIIKQAREDALSVLAEAKENGYTTGITRAEEQTKSLIITAKAIVQEVGVWHEGMLGKSESEVLGLAKTIAVKLFGEGFNLGEEDLTQVFNHELVEARALGDLRIYVSPNDATTLGPYWQEQQTAYRGQKIELIPSDAILPGGCFIEGQYGTLDARVESQLGIILDAITANAATEPERPALKESES